MSAPVESGTEVTYHGSRLDRHGDAIVIAAFDHDDPAVPASDDGYHYVLATKDTILYDVRRQSFTVEGDGIVISDEPEVEDFPPAEIPHEDEEVAALVRSSVN